MSKVFRLFFGAAVALASVAALAQAENPETRKEIQKVYGKWDKLVAAGDIKGLFAMIDPSFVGIDKDGRAMSYGDARKMFESIFKTLREPKSKITVNQIQEQGDEIVAWVSMTVSFKAKQGSKWVPTTFTSQFAETLKRIGGEWKFIASQELP